MFDTLERGRIGAALVAMMVAAGCGGGGDDTGAGGGGGAGGAVVENPVDPATAGSIGGRVMFTGTPDDVYEQMVDFYETVGGFGHFLMMAQAGRMSYKDTADNISLFAKEVLPRIKDYTRARAKSWGIPERAVA